MDIPLYQIDAFAARPFAGNPAAVCPLEAWLPDATLQAIAAENNLSETAFLVSAGGDYDLRWFTPTVEVDLCGHATLAAGFVIATYLAPGVTEMRFQTRSGPLGVSRRDDRYALDFPARPAEPCPPPPALIQSLGRRPSEILVAERDYLAVYPDEADVRALAPDMVGLAALGRVGVIATAAGRDADFVSRFFAPAFGIPEDPVTGSAHCTLVPYWARRLGKTTMFARQVSRRGGELDCEDRGSRVVIAGRATCYLEGRIHV